MYGNEKKKLLPVNYLYSPKRLLMVVDFFYYTERGKSQQKITSKLPTITSACRAEWT